MARKVTRRRHRARRAGADRAARHRPRPLGLGGDPPQPLLRRRTRRSYRVWEAHLETIRKAGSSTGAVVEVEAVGVPAGWGAPIYGKLDAELAAGLMSINAVKGVEIGAGFAAAALTGEENADEMRLGNDGPLFLSNHAGRRPGRHFHRPADHRPGGVQAHLLDPHPPPLDQ